MRPLTKRTVVRSAFFAKDGPTAAAFKEGKRMKMFRSHCGLMMNRRFQSKRAHKESCASLKDAHYIRMQLLVGIRLCTGKSLAS